MQIKDLFIPVELENTDENQKMGNKKFQTTDMVFLDSDDDIKDLSNEERKTTATDYAVMNNGFVSSRNGNTWYWLRSAGSEDHAYYVGCGGNNSIMIADITDCCVRPAIRLNLSSFLSARRSQRDFGKITISGDNCTINLGEYPKSHAENDKELEKLFKTGSLKKTGKKYTGYMNAGSFVCNKEFEYGGEKFVRVVCKKCDGNSHFTDGNDCPETYGVSWAVVEPITWKIRNWDDLPRKINPKGTGKAKYIDIQTEEGILSGIPFYPLCGYNEGCDTMWQNSVIRAYLNGYDLHKEIDRGNGNRNYKASENFNFEGHGFLQEAGLDAEIVISQSEEKKDRLQAVLDDFGFKSEKQLRSTLTLLNKLMENKREQKTTHLDDGKGGKE